MKVSIDSRTIKKGDYFVPIIGPNFDGHDYIKGVLKNGARGIISEKKFYNLAQLKIRDKKPFIIAIAGSIGKSTFRSYLCSIFTAKFDVLESDLNTKLGFSLKIINELNKQNIIVAEVGIDRIGEMKDTASFIKPDLAVITKLGKEHLQFFKTFKNVVKEESEIFKHTIINKYYINSEDMRYYKNIEINKKYLTPFNLPIKNLDVEDKIKNLLLPDHEKDYLRGIYRIVTQHFFLTDKDFVAGLKKLVKPKGRLNILRGENGCIIIDDTYNAVCDQAIINGIKFASKIAIDENKKLHLIISNMRENGASKFAQHKNVAKFIDNCTYVDVKIFGDETELYKKYIKKACLAYNDVSQIKLAPNKNDVFYIKSANYFKGYKLVESLVNGV